jgi:hypothetical protein
VDALEFRSGTGLGQPLPAYLAKPTDRVTVDGMETTVANAMAMGLLRPDPEGGFKLTPRGEAEEARQQQRAHATALAAQAEEAAFAQATALPAEIAQLHAQVRQAVPADVQSRALAELATDAGLSKLTLNQLANALGCSEDRAHVTALKIGMAMDEQAARAMAHEGINEACADAFEAWGKSRPAELRQAQMRHLHGGDLGGYRSLTKEFLRTNRHVVQRGYIEAEVGPGVKSRVVGTGGGSQGLQRVVTLPGGMEVSMETAIKLGHVKIG